MDHLSVHLSFCMITLRDSLWYCRDFLNPQTDFDLSDRSDWLKLQDISINQQTEHTRPGCRSFYLCTWSKLPVFCRRHQTLQLTTRSTTAIYVSSVEFIELNDEALSVSSSTPTVYTQQHTVRINIPGVWYRACIKRRTPGLFTNSARHSTIPLCLPDGRKLRGDWSGTAGTKTEVRE